MCLLRFDIKEKTIIEAFVRFRFNIVVITGIIVSSKAFFIVEALILKIHLVKLTLSTIGTNHQN
jgi:hypothetical protein